jgi:uncharacterized protein (TIGR03435 family)
MIATLMNHLWQSTLFVLAAAITAAALRKNGAHIRHGVWVIASLKFLVPFSLLISVGSALPLFTPTAVITDTRAAAPALPLAVDRFVQPFTSDEFGLTTTMGATASATNRTPMVLLAIWVIGLLAVVWTRLRGWQRIRGLVRQSTPVALRSPIPVRSSPGLLEPGVVGIRRPVLLVPAGIEQRLTPSQFDAVFAHELCHVHRRDNLTAAIHMVVEAVFWFHPLVWWIGARMVAERERACDEYVLRAFGEPENYAESILNVCKLYVESPLPCVSGVSRSDLKKRVAAIMVNRIGTRLNLARKTALTLAAILAIVLPLIVGMLTAPVRASLRQVPAFEVASVKPATPRDAGSATGPRPTGAPPASSQGDPSLSIYSGATLKALLIRAYALRPYQIVGPSWLDSEKYDVIAKVPEGASREQIPLMLQTLLLERFRMSVHWGSKEAPIYALVVGKSGPKLTRSQPDTKKSVFFGQGRLALKGSTLADFAGALSSALDRPVVDMTNIEGIFDIVLEASPDSFTGPFLRGAGTDSTADSSAAPSVFTAVHELGLSLDARKAPIKQLVVDKAEKVPIPN